MNASSLIAALESAERITRWCASRIGAAHGQQKALPENPNALEGWEIDDLMDGAAEQVAALTQAGLAPHTAERFVQQWWAAAYEEGYEVAIAAHQNI